MTEIDSVVLRVINSKNIFKNSEGLNGLQKNIK